MNGMYIAFAPLQGYTDAIYRRAHWECAGGVTEYYTPFVRMEKGEPRKRDMRDIAPEACVGVPTVPQVIAKDGEEFARLCDAVQTLGWKRIDLNMGCPFPMQTKSGRGCGLLQYPDRIEEIAREMQSRKEVTFSVKMRLGQETVNEGLTAMSIINDMPLVHITLHPRLGIQQYNGTTDKVAFERFVEVSRWPMVYNGDLLELKVENGELRVDALNVKSQEIKGVMIGRGLLAQPWMLSGKEPQVVLREMHGKIYQHATEHLCGEKQVIARLRAFWEYVPIGHKQHKAIMKAMTLSRYDEAVATVFGRGN